VHLIQTKDFDPYPAKGAIKRVQVKFFDFLQQSVEELVELG
jgi:hypothetical protein